MNLKQYSVVQILHDITKLGVLWGFHKQRGPFIDILTHPPLTNHVFVSTY